MKLIRQSRLFFKDGKSDKVYEVDLCDLGSSAGEKRYVVNFRYGRRGKSLREGSKTESPVDFDEAVKLFNSVVVSKTNKGYQEAGEQQSDQAAAKLESVSKPGADRDASINAAEQKLIEKLELARQRAISSHEAKRVIWRAGERGISAATSLIADLVGSDDAIMDYCIAWALGRCGDASTMPVLQQIQNQHGLNPAGRMAREARLSLASESQRHSLIEEISQQLAPDLLRIIKTGDTIAIDSQLSMIIASPQNTTSDLLCDLYSLSMDNSALHASLCHAFQTIPFRANLFKAVRRIFKHAEFRKDALMFGVLSYRFEKDKHNNYWDLYYSYPVDQRRNESPSQIFTVETKRYLRKRSWRCLKRLAELNDSAFAEMASEHLLKFTDEDAGRAYQRRLWDYSLRRDIVYNYDEYSHFVSFNHLLYQNSAHLRLSRDRNKWFRVENTEALEGYRCEAFPELWDQQPQLLLRLLCHSRCRPVHRFALRAIKTNQAFCQQIAIADLTRMLSQVYEETSAFALSLAQAIVKRNQTTAELLRALLDSRLAAARALAFDVINAHHNWLLENEDLLLSSLCSEYEDVRLWIRRLAGELALSQQAQRNLVARLIAHAMGLDSSQAQQKAVIDDISWVLSNVFTAISREINLQIIEDLLQHDDTAIQALGARLLLQHEVPAEQMPGHLIRRLLEASSAEVRSLGVQLLGNLPDATLLAQPALIVQLALSGDAEVRQAARPIIQRLAGVDQEFANNALLHFLNYLFRRETTPGLHDDILQIVKTDLNHVANLIDKDTTWRLLQGKSKAAQLYGEHLLSRFVFADFSVRQLARLAGNPQLTVRQWAWNAYKTDVDRFKQQSQDALVVLDSDWDDARDFAKEYFNQHFTQEDWRPELLVSICDSVRADVQQYGRELISRFFQAEHGVEYLTKLSEHPSANVQLFASNYLQQYAGGNTERLQALRSYFVTILSQVNRARIAKSRINRFLGEEAVRSRECALLVSDIYSRQSVSDAMVDKHACIKMLYQVKMRFPDIDMPLSLHAPRQYAPSTREAG